MGEPTTSVDDIEVNLLRVYGTIVGGARLAKALGYPTPEAFRKAAIRGRAPVPLISIEGRRGRFARVRDIACWLHAGAVNSSPLSQPSAPAAHRGDQHDLAP